MLTTNKSTTTSPLKTVITGTSAGYRWADTQFPCDRHGGREGGGLERDRDKSGDALTYQAGHK